MSFKILRVWGSFSVRRELPLNLASASVSQMILISVLILMSAACHPLTGHRRWAVLYSRSLTNTAKSWTLHWDMQEFIQVNIINMVCVYMCWTHTRSRLLCAGAVNSECQSWSSVLHEEVRAHDGDAAQISGQLFSSELQFLTDWLIWNNHVILLAINNNHNYSCRNYQLGEKCRLQHWVLYLLPRHQRLHERRCLYGSLHRIKSSALSQILSLNQPSDTVWTRGSLCSVIVSSCWNEELDSSSEYKERSSHAFCIIHSQFEFCYSCCWED